MISFVYHHTYKRTINFLIKALKSERLDVQLSAAEALGQLDSTQAIVALTQALQDNGHPHFRSQLIEALGQVNSSQAGSTQVIAALIQLLQDQNCHHKFRATAAKSLGQIGSPQAITALVKSLQDEEKWVRFCAAEALKKIGNSSTLAKKILTELFESSSTSYYDCCAFNLARLLTIRAVDHLQIYHSSVNFSGVNTNSSSVIRANLHSRSKRKSLASSKPKKKLRNCD